MLPLGWSKLVQDQELSYRFHQYRQLQFQEGCCFTSIVDTGTCAHLAHSVLVCFCSFGFNLAYRHLIKRLVELRSSSHGIKGWCNVVFSEVPNVILPTLQDGCASLLSKLNS